MATADDGEAPARLVPPCGNPACPAPNDAVRLQYIPEAFTGAVRPGATCFHRKRAGCAEHFGFQDPPKKRGRPRKDEKLLIPVGKRLASDECPPILRRIDEIWGHRCATCPVHLCTPPDRCFCARRLVDISEMRDEDRRQPLTDGSIMEYLVHGEFAYKESDINSTFGAWWVPLRRMIKELGKEVVEKELELMDSEAMQIRLQVFDDALEDDSSDDEEGG